MKPKLLPRLPGQEPTSPFSAPLLRGLIVAGILLGLIMLSLWLRSAG